RERELNAASGSTTGERRVYHLYPRSCPNQIGRNRLAIGKPPRHDEQSADAYAEVPLLIYGGFSFLYDPRSSTRHHSPNRYVRSPAFNGSIQHLWTSARGVYS